jgi:hypothetical protein
MGYNFRDYNPNQLLPLAPNLKDWLPQRHLARFISDVVGSLSMISPLQDVQTQLGDPGFSLHRGVSRFVKGRRRSIKTKDGL